MSSEVSSRINEKKFSKSPIGNLVSMFSGSQDFPKCLWFVRSRVKADVSFPEDANVSGTRDSKSTQYSEHVPEPLIHARTNIEVEIEIETWTLCAACRSWWFFHPLNLVLLDLGTSANAYWAPWGTAVVLATSDHDGQCLSCLVSTEILLLDLIT
jgi:hypothetical protein